MNLLIGLAVILLGLAAYVALRTPIGVPISRTIVVSSSPERLFPYLNDPRLIQQWNPFVDEDPTIETKFGGPTSGVGAQWEWAGKKAGAGQATIIEVEPNRRVGLRLDFKKPFHVTNFGEYALSPRADGTEVRWTINETHIIPRVINNFVNLDKVIGAHFEKGLAKLKTLAEHPAAVGAER